MSSHSIVLSVSFAALTGVDSAQPPHTEGAGINLIALAHFPCQCSPFTHESYRG
ncbi:exported protein of unknown function [Citrobacter amalonaticus]|nr:exported protein of unknown function [Citrobacter amalonaticus]